MSRRSVESSSHVRLRGSPSSYIQAEKFSASVSAMNTSYHALNTGINGKHLRPMWIHLAVACFVTGLLVHFFDKFTMTFNDAYSVSVTFRNESNGDAFEDPNPLSPWPRIAWLMSYPNSGTTFTTELVYTITNMTIATNYGLETVVDSEGRQGTPALNHSALGPFWKFSDWEKPHRYIMTKTHCGGRCTACRPESYIETVRSFSVACRTGSFVRLLNGTKNGTKEYATYNEGIAQRAIHLIRNPFDNLVSRLHMERKNWAVRADGREDEIKARLEEFTSDKPGLKAWCTYIHLARAKEEDESRFYDAEIKSLVQNLPCHSEFFRYVQWHNMAHEVTERLHLPTMTLFYENYTTNFNQTVTDLLNFLELPTVNNAPEFITGKQYDTFFEPEECRTAATLAKMLASPKTWLSIRHYFENWL